MIEVSLTQFIDFTLIGSGTARTNYVRRVKYGNYSVPTDYWKQLRDAIKKIHQNKQPVSKLYDLLNHVNEKKRENYRRAINQYVSFCKDKHLEWFDTGSSSWIFNEQLLVRSSPELGLYIDGSPVLLKIYYKGKKHRMDKYKVQSTLTLMEISNRDFLPPENAVSALLNLQNKKLYTPSPINNDLLVSLEGDAAQFIHIYQKV
jgi:hypothetical protein